MSGCLFFLFFFDDAVILPFVSTFVCVCVTPALLEFPKRTVGLSSPGCLSSLPSVYWIRVGTGMIRPSSWLHQLHSVRAQCGTQRTRMKDDLSAPSPAGWAANTRGQCFPFWAHNSCQPRLVLRTWCALRSQLLEGKEEKAIWFVVAASRPLSLREAGVLSVAPVQREMVFKVLSCGGSPLVAGGSCDTINAALPLFE